jgi:hypothetical protein
VPAIALLTVTAWPLRSVFMRWPSLGPRFVSRERAAIGGAGERGGDQ